MWELGDDVCKGFCMVSSMEQASKLVAELVITTFLFPALGQLLHFTTLHLTLFTRYDLLILAL